MSEFAFVGRLSASKSMLIRAWIIKSYFPEVNIEGESECDDALAIKRAVNGLLAGERDLNVGASGAALRFLAFRVSRESGMFTLKGTQRLFSRPQQELIKILHQLGVRATLGEDFIRIEGEGWRLQGDTLLVPGDRSSQFASGVLLNAWNLPFDLYVSLGRNAVSLSYWRMTVQMALDLGMKIDFWDLDFRVPKMQTLESKNIRCEIDLSSAFVIAAIAAVSGRATLLDYPSKSLQPDRIFPDILKAMGVGVSESDGALKVERARTLNGIRVDLRNAPDLFPVLATLAALANGESEFTGATQLIHKESNRIERVAELITKMGRKVQVTDQGLSILGSEPVKPSCSFDFDCDEDHRLGFAAAVVRAAGFEIKLSGAEAVSKSFPDFWRIVGC